jgi:hypothetical protein
MQVPWSAGVVPLHKQAHALKTQRMLHAAVVWAKTRGWFSLGEMRRDLRLTHHFTGSRVFKSWLAEHIFESNGETTRARRYRLARPPTRE